jgi:hypothetical protein
MTQNLELVLFEHDSIQIRALAQLGLSSFMVDCEYRDKVTRQMGADTEIAPRALNDLKPLQSILKIIPSCRINRFGEWTEFEVKQSISNGAKRIFLPMVEKFNEVEKFIHFTKGCAEAAILIETKEGVRISRELAKLPLSAVYVGLNDLAISRGSGSIFAAICDGTVERVRDAFLDTKFGFAGATRVDAGAPVPCHLLIQEMSRIDAGFTFLRRSWKRDIEGYDVTHELNRIQDCFTSQKKKSRSQLASDHRVLLKYLRQRGLNR